MEVNFLKYIIKQKFEEKKFSFNNTNFNINKECHGSCETCSGEN